jgi:hypothetical protein
MYTKLNWKINPEDKRYEFKITFSLKTDAKVDDEISSEELKQELIKYFVDSDYSSFTDSAVENITIEKLNEKEDERV